MAGINVSTSESTSNPVVEQTPQSEESLALAQWLQGLAQSTYSWGMNQFENNLLPQTEQQVNTLQDYANDAIGQSETLWNTFNNQGLPALSNWGQQAATYASTPRINQAMGQAQSDTMQAANQQRQQTLQQLQQMGVNPSAPEYADIANISATAAAASAAGAGQQAEQYTENTGRQMQQQYVDYMMNLPAASVNAENQATQAEGTAASALNSAFNTGVNLIDSASPYANAATNIKLPPVGQQSQSKASSFGISGGSGGGQSGGQNSGGGTYSEGNDVPLIPEQTTASPQIINVQGGDSGGGYNPQSMGGDYTLDTSTPDNSGGDFAGAEGGEIPDGHGPTTGGYLDHHLSPSGGRQTDDIKANLNAGEFVIPDDVVHWRGKAFYQKDIAKARQEMESPGNVHGTMKPMTPGPTRFVSHRVHT